MSSEKEKVISFYREGGPAIGDILYWDGTDWVSLPAGTSGQILAVGSSGIPEWQDPPVA